MASESESPIPTDRDYPGYLVVIEGIDGTGKSTLCARLREVLKERGIGATLSREPTDGPYGKKIRAMAASGSTRVSLEEELNLFVEDRREHVAQVILPHLRAGKLIILDRYFYSTMAYQGARGADAAAILALHQAFAPEPDLLVILELDVSEALNRVRHSRGSTPDAFEDESYLRAVSAGFDRVRHPNLLRLDASLPTEDLAIRIADRIGQKWMPDVKPTTNA